MQSAECARTVMGPLSLVICNGRGETAKMAGRPVGPKRNSPGQRPGLRGGSAPPFFLPSALKRRDGQKSPLRPFRALQRRQNTAPDGYRQRLPWALPRAVTSQPFRLSGHTCQARWRCDSFNSCARGGQARQSPGDSGQAGKRAKSHGTWNPPQAGRPGT